MSDVSVSYTVYAVEGIAAILDGRANEMWALSKSATTQKDKMKWYWQADAYEAAANIVRRTRIVERREAANVAS